MDSTMNLALDSPSLRTFTAVRIELPSHTINVIEGSGVVAFPVNGVTTTFDGRDPIYGTLAGLATVAERVAREAPRVSISMLPPSSTAIGSLLQPENQESRVYVWWGLVNYNTGAVIGTPELLWSGRLDTAKVTLSDGGQVVELDTVSAFDRLFVAEEGARLNGVWHKSVWPGETGLDFNVTATIDPYWGMEAPARSAISSGGYYGGGGGGGGGGFGGLDLNMSDLR